MGYGTAIVTGSPPEANTTTACTHDWLASTAAILAVSSDGVNGF